MVKLNSEEGNPHTPQTEGGTMDFFQKVQKKKKKKAYVESYRLQENCALVIFQDGGCGPIFPTISAF